MSATLNNTKIKVLLVTHYYPSHKSGIELVAFQLVKHLTSKYLIDVTWAASNTDPSPNNIKDLHCIPMQAFNFMERFG